MKPTLFLAGVLIAASAATAAAGPIRVNPTGVNVNGQGATSTFLTFGGLGDYQPAEALWCGALVSAAPDVGSRCDASTLYGVLPARYNRSQISGIAAFTDIMSIPPSVARRAYQAAASRTRSAEFFYVRHFVSPGKPDQYVAVTCRLTGGGARVPLSLVDVELKFDVDTPILQVRAGDRVPALFAQVVYTGTGRLQGRWEIVSPGQDLPSSDDLLTEATLPLERRGQQRRYAEIDRFNVFLGPTGRYTLPGPDPERLPTTAQGQYLVLLRIEASDDKEADSDLADVNAGTTVVHAGGVAGFPMPVLRYVVGSGGSELSSSPTDSTGVEPADAVTVKVDDVVDLRWLASSHAQYVRVEVEVAGALVHRAFVAPDTRSYRLPPFVTQRAAGSTLMWRVVTVDAGGRDGTGSGWRRLIVAN